MHDGLGARPQLSTIYAVVDSKASDSVLMMLLLDQCGLRAALCWKKKMHATINTNRAAEAEKRLKAKPPSATGLSRKSNPRARCHLPCCCACRRRAGRRCQFDGCSCALASGVVTLGLGYIVRHPVLPQFNATQMVTFQLSAPLLAAVDGVWFLAKHRRRSCWTAGRRSPVALLW